MAQAIGLNPAINTLPLVQEKPCYTELLERIQAIWNAVCMWICDLANRLLSWNTSLNGERVIDPVKNDPSKSLPVETPATTQPNISQTQHDLALRNQNCFCHMVRYLEPEEVARNERVAKSWKIERIWQAQCANHGVTVAPPSGRFKDLFIVPEMAFGPKEWRKHFGKIGLMPPLQANIKEQVAQLKDTHTLTLIPATVNGQPLSLNTFAPLAEKAGMKLAISDTVSKKYGNEAAGKSLWVWVQKDIEPGSRSKTQAQSEKDYPQKLGKALWITVSTVAHYARYKICLFPQKPEWTYTRTRDGGEDQYGAWYVVVGGSAPGVLRVSHYYYASDYIGVAGAVPAEVQAIGP